MDTECEEVNKLSNIYTAVEKAALLQHFAVYKLATIGTCQCSDITYNFKSFFSVSLKLTKIVVLIFL